jgi:hypothetical protein
MMKKTGILTMIVSILIVTFCLNVYAQQISAQVTALEKQAMRIQSQIDHAKSQGTAVMNQQVQALKNSLNHLMQQRVRVDAQIAKLESQIDELQSSSNSVLTRQIDQYNKDLSRVKQEMAGLMAKQAAKPAPPTQPAALKPNVQQVTPAVQAAPTAPGPAVQQVAPAAKPAPAAQKGANLSTQQCPSCPADSAGKASAMPKLPTLNVKPSANSKPAAVKAQVNPHPAPAVAAKPQAAGGSAVKAAPKNTIPAGAAKKIQAPSAAKKVADVKAAAAPAAK